jgi:hypothetical protein
LLPACSLLGSLDDLQSGSVSNDRDAGDDASLDAPTLDAADDVLVVDVDCTGWCTLPNSLAACVDSSCAISTCNPPYQDCDQQGSTGCEANTSSSSSHCGGCNKPCNAPDGTAQCVSGQCVVSCPTGFEDCNGNPNDGCEAVLDHDGNHCGGCGGSCDTGKACLNGSCVVSECDNEHGVLRVRPSSDASTGLWSAVPAAPFYEQIDDSGSNDGAATFVWDDTQTAPSEAIFGATNVDVPAGRKVVSVVLSAWVRLNPTATQPSNFWLIARVDNDEDNAATPQITSTAFVQVSHEWTNKPDAATPWTEADLDAIEIGFAHQKPSSLTNPVEVTKLWLEVCLGSP